MLENRRVVAIAYDGLCAFEFGVATELFGLARPELKVPWYEYRVVAASDGPLRALGGITVQASADLRHVRRAGTIVLPGWSDRFVRPPAALLSALRHAHANGARIMSICSGAFVLAATGLLDGQAATTHWRYTDDLAAMYPSIDVKPNVLYVDNGSVLTSAGSAAGIDLGLHLIRRDHGAAVAAEVARRLVVSPQREGGQAQFIRHPATTAETHDQRLATTMAWARANLHTALTVQDLARRAHMASRTFARRFVDETGTTPLAWILKQRLQLAQEMLETTDRSIGNIASAVGFATPETMRHHFRQELQTSPSTYRTTFSL
jgi:AraC family transcriptional regulator, transcriptional activator FtrA